MAKRLHGFVPPGEDDTPGALYFGFLRLCQNAVFTPLTASQASPRQRVDPRWLDPVFQGAARNMQTTLWKLDRTAGLLGEALQTLTLNPGLDDMTAFGRSQQAMMLAPLYLDLMLVYLRVFADTIARTLPSFYARRGHIPTDSFSNQVNWFRNRRRNFDPDYAAVLDQHLEWYDILAAEGTGLRNQILHGDASVEFIFTVTEPPAPRAVQAALVGQQAWLHDDVMPLIRSIVSGMCLYLDETLHLILRRAEEFGPLVYDPRTFSGVLFHFRGDFLGGTWLYPRIDNAA